MLKHGGKNGCSGDRMATIWAGRSSKLLSFCCLKACLELIFAVSSLKIMLLPLKCGLKRFENTSMKTVHVQPSGGHSDGSVALCESMTD